MTLLRRPERSVEGRPPLAWSSRLEVGLAVLMGVIGLGLTGLVCVRLSDDPGVYWASQRVSILAPRSTENPNTFQLSLRSINMTAGVVAQLASDDRRAERAVEPEMPLANVGIRSGWSVQQPDRGGQWSHQYSDPYVTIQVVDPDPARVEREMSLLEGRVLDAISEIQDDARVATVNRFVITTSPPTANVEYQGGSRPRALAATSLLGLGLTLLLMRCSVALLRRRTGTSAISRASGSDTGARSHTTQGGVLMGDNMTKQVSI